MTSLQDESPADNDVRARRFNDALDKFLELIDEKATLENFQTALPDVKPKLLEGMRKNIVTHLKSSIKVEKDRLVESYELEEKLAQLQKLTEEAEHRRTSGKEKSLNDVWRPNLDFAAVLFSRSIQTQRQNVGQLEEELRELEEENTAMLSELNYAMSTEEELRKEARDTLQRLEDSISGIETTADTSEQLRATIDLLLQELGPRSISA